ncbi:MAG: hypothetical protein WCT27_03640 [Patescibacteria group bacterium]
MKKTFIIIGTVIVVAVVVLLAIRFFTPEDSWICDNGQWVKHGNPSAAKPTNGCLGSATNTEQVITVSEAVVSPNDFKNKDICLSGYYSVSFESSILVPITEVTVLADGSQKINQTNWRDFTVWIGKSVPGIGSDCDIPVDSNSTQDRNCSKETVICGNFSVASPETAGFGHLGGYRFKLE